MTCRYVFTVEWLESMSAACYDCPFNMTDCDRPGCIPVNGVQRPIITVNRQLPGPPIEVMINTLRFLYFVGHYIPYKNTKQYRDLVMYIIVL